MSGLPGSLDTFFQTGWSKAVWKPATYDLKTRKFKCDSDQTVVSEKTGSSWPSEKYSCSFFPRWLFR